jgi:hypothetical protein
MGADCKDLCCTRGEDVSLNEYLRIIQHHRELEPLLNIPIKQCFSNHFIEDNDFGGGSYTHTVVVNDMCTFHQVLRGCILHTFKIKPMVGSLFPITFNYGLLLPSYEILYNLDDCRENGLTLYQSAKNDLLYYFGKEFISELDLLEHTLPTKE